MCNAPHRKNNKPSKYNLPKIPEKDSTPLILSLLSSLKNIRAGIKSIYRKRRKDSSVMEDKRYARISPVTKFYFMETAIVEQLNAMGIKVKTMPPT